MVGPIAEEAMYRGLLFEAFRRRSNAWIGAILSSLLFAMMHLEPIMSGVAGFIFAMIAVSLRSRSASLAPSSALHALVNAPYMLLTIGGF